MDTALADRLTQLDYAEVFQQPDESVLEGIWTEAGAPESLAALAIDSEAPLLSRFLAAEILFHNLETYPPAAQKPHLSSTYASALAENLAGTANTWGLPGVFDGLAGEHLLSLGEAAVPELVKLLDDDRSVYYEGSEEATIGHSYRYRVKDLAAYYISRIRNIPLEMSEDPDRRDEEILELKAAVE